jgi:hypothetical protein
MKENIQVEERHCLIVIKIWIVACEKMRNFAIVIAERNLIIRGSMGYTQML